MAKADHSKGTFEFEGSNITTTYSRSSYTANYDALSKLASNVCEDLFSGPRPTFGWWDVCGEETSESKAVRGWRPRAIISVTGGALDAQNSIKDMDKIIKTIVMTAKEMKALIVTGGSAVGVMKQIGTVVEQDGNHVALLGIFPWNAIVDEGKYAIESETQNKTYRATFLDDIEYHEDVGSLPPGQRDVVRRDVVMRKAAAGGDVDQDEVITKSYCDAKEVSESY
jgi:hypothetical protein